MSLPKLKFMILSSDIGEESTLNGNGMNTGGYVVLHALGRALDSLGMDVKMFVINCNDYSTPDKDISKIQNKIFNKFVINPFGYNGVSPSNENKGMKRWHTDIFDDNTSTSGTWTFIEKNFTDIVSRTRNKCRSPCWADDDTIVIYSETVRDNPLFAKNVVRWILADIGKFSANFDSSGNFTDCGLSASDTISKWGKDDLLFHYNDMGNDNVDILTVSWIDPVFSWRNKNKRVGSCHMYRKIGKDIWDDIDNIPDSEKHGIFMDRIKNMSFHPQDSVHFEGDGPGSYIVKNQFGIKCLKNDEIADLFNDKKYFYSYDKFSQLSVYAGMCGCIPVVKKIPGLSKKDWLNNFGPTGFYKMNSDNFPGIAYGDDDIEYAERTISEFRDFCQKCNQFEQDSVRDFVNKVSSHFFPEKYKSGDSITASNIASNMFPNQKWETNDLNVANSYAFYNDNSYIINYNTMELFINVGSNDEIRVKKVGDLNDKTFRGNGFVYTPVLSEEQKQKNINISSKQMNSSEDNLVKKTYNGLEFYVNSRNRKAYLLKEVGTWTPERGFDFNSR